MEAVLTHSSTAPNISHVPVPEPLAEQQQSAEDYPEEITFPSVSAYEDTLFSEIPKSNEDLEMALAAIQVARAREAREAKPEIQPGPGESEASEWLRIPQE